MKKFLSVCLVAFMALSMSASDRAWTDYLKGVGADSGVNLEVQADRAASLAAKEIVGKLQASSFAGKRIAFLPMEEDTYGFSDIIGAQLSAEAGRFDFYTRDKEYWQKLASEYDLAGDGKNGGYADLFDEATLNKFDDASLKGVEAIVTGRIRGLSVMKDGKVNVRLTFKMTDIKTFRQVVTGYVDVSYPQESGVKVYENYSPELLSAIEDAAYKFSSEVLNKKLDIGRIALLPFENDAMNISELLQNELARTPGMNDFYVRGDADWAKLNKERVFSGTQKDILNSDTVANLTKIHGVKAIISGKVLHVPVADSKDVRVSFTARVINVETGALIYGGTVTGSHREPIIAKPISRPLRKALEKTGEKLLVSLKTRFPRDKKVRVYMTPFVGVKPEIQKYLKPYMTRAKSNQLSFFDLSSSASEKSLNNRIGEQLAGTNLGFKELARIMSQLDRIDSSFEGGFSNGAQVSKDEIVRAVLTGDVLSASEGELVAGRYESVVTVSFDIKSLKTGELLWTETLTGEYMETDQEYNYRINEEAQNKKAASDAEVKDYIREGLGEENLIKRIIDNLGLIIGSIVGLLVLLFILSKMTRTR